LRRSTAARDSGRPPADTPASPDTPTSYSYEGEPIDCVDLSLVIKAKDPELNFIERAEIVSNARRRRICIDGLRDREP
jgi:hypothetical protein